jgi:hypothetical protein
MKIYLQSRGFEQDYNWVDEVQKIVDNPDIFNKFGNLLQATKRSLLLAQSQDKLLLSVTNIESPNRQDYQNRKIRVSIAWVSEYNPDNLDYFRYLAIRILKSFIGEDDFTQKISDAVESGGENGFTVKSFDVLEPSQGNSNSLAIKQNSVLPQKLLRIEDDNFQELIQDLIIDLESYDLPTEDGPLVVITGIQDQSVFDKAGVWYGIAKFTEPVRPILSGEGVKTEKKPSINPIIPALIVMFILVGILIILMTFKQPNPPSPPSAPSKTLEKQESQQQQPECDQDLIERSIPCWENSKTEESIQQSLTNG